MARQANTIEEVITIMDNIIEDCMLKKSRLGYFASLYRMVTVIVKERCDDGNFFEDNDRMRKLDVIFANRYFDAYDAYLLRQGKPTESWLASFEASRKRELIILQHLLLGMNAHISLDLGIATAEIANGNIDESLQRDFNRLNNLLSGLIDTVQKEIAIVSPLFKYVDEIALRTDEAFVSYSINIARDKAWEFALNLTKLPQSEWPEKIVLRDRSVAGFSKMIGSSNWYFRPILWIFNLAESKDPRKITEILSNQKWEKAVKSRLYALLHEVEKRGLDLSKRDTQLTAVPAELTE